jgi:hypothetical protein
VYFVTKKEVVGVFAFFVRRFRLSRLGEIIV